MQFDVNDDIILTSMKHFYSYILWGQLKGVYSKISEDMIENYWEPRSTSAVERNQKIGKKVLSQTRCHLYDLQYEKQDSIMHNSIHIRRKLPPQIHGWLYETISKLLSPLPTSISENETELNVAETEQTTERDYEAILLETGILDVDNPSFIPDSLIFTEKEEDE